MSLRDRILRGDPRAVGELSDRIRAHGGKHDDVIRRVRAIFSEAHAAEPSVAEVEAWLLGGRVASGRGGTMMVVDVWVTKKKIRTLFPHVVAEGPYGASPDLLRCAIEDVVGACLVSLGSRAHAPRELRIVVRGACESCCRIIGGDEVGPCPECLAKKAPR